MKYWLRIKMRRFYEFLTDFIWLWQAYFRGKILMQKEYCFIVSGYNIIVPSVKTTGSRINMLARLSGYILLDAGYLRLVLKKNPPLGDCSAYLAEEWQEHRTWPKIGHFVDGDGTHGEAYIADHPHFLVVRR